MSSLIEGNNRKYSFKASLDLSPCMLVKYLIIYLRTSEEALESVTQHFSLPGGKPSEIRANIQEIFLLG